MARTTFLASAIPGIGAILAEELAGAGHDVSPPVLFDGRNDLVAFQASGTAALGQIATAEDLFVEAATARGSNLDRLSAALVRTHELDRALSVAAGQGRRLPSNATFRVVARVRSERYFKRTELRSAVTAAVAGLRPRWRAGDPAHVELWVLETEPGKFRLGLRLTTAERRQRGGRVTERTGALRPTVAAAMVRLAGQPGGLLLDPCCGSGTVVREASAVGWPAVGGDSDRDAIDAAVANTPASALLVADVRALPIPDGTCRAVVSNLPFGTQFAVDDPARWYAAALDELSRVVAAGGSIVLLAPRLAEPRRLHALQLERRVAVQLLGQRTTLWHFRRR